LGKISFVVERFWSINPLEVRFLHYADLFSPSKHKSDLRPQNLRKKYYSSGLVSFRLALRFNKWSDIAHDFIPISPD